MNNQAKLFWIFDMLGDMERTGPILWQVDRQRLEDIKDHVFDMITIDRLLAPYLPMHINHERIIELALVHDLEEVITGDITIFEGISIEEKRRVTNIAREYLINTFGNIIPLKKLYSEYDNVSSIESKICHMYDKIQSIITFAKYDAENEIDIDNPKIIRILRELPLIIEGKNAGKKLSEIFYDYHIKSVNFSEEEIQRYKIDTAEALSISQVIKSFVKSIMSTAKDINNIKSNFPEEATIYKR